MKLPNLCVGPLVEIRGLPSGDRASPQVLVNLVQMPTCRITTAGRNRSAGRCIGAHHLIYSQYQQQLPKKGQSQGRVDLGGHWIPVCAMAISAA